LCRDVGPFRRLGVDVRAGRVEGPALKRALLSIAKAASFARTLFISGESGSGKEHFARAFHQAGPQRTGNFVSVNCATIPEGIAERVLFGAVKGAYSGATDDSEGYVQAAGGGTLFLDEVGDLATAVQAKLLRVLESGEVTPLGATRPRTVNVRVVCATCKDLRRLVAAGTFRADLYFRIAVPEIGVPPLRERLEEIPWLVASAAAATRPDLAIHASLVEACMLRPWPGNVRELLAEISTAVIAALGHDGETVTAEHLRPTAGASLAPTGETVPAVAPADPEALRGRLDALERQKVLDAIDACGGNQTHAATKLGISRRTLVARLTEWGLTKRRGR
jgi:DNA-binding NtrC family response regulator